MAMGSKQDAPEIRAARERVKRACIAAAKPFSCFCGSIAAAQKLRNEKGAGLVVALSDQSLLLAGARALMETEPAPAA